MVLLLFSAFLWIGAAVFGALAARRGPDVFWAGVRLGGREMTFITPRIVFGVLGAGFVAELLPPEAVRALLGADSGSLGVFISAAAGALAPGGPVLVYAVGGAAMAAGAGAPQVMTFVCAWLLFSLNRTLVWEAPVMGAAHVRDRMLLSAPIPLIVGHLALALA